VLSLHSSLLHVNPLFVRHVSVVQSLTVAGVLYHSKKDGKPELIPIPGASSVDRVKENSKVVTLSDEDVNKIDEILKSFDVAGTRYPEQMMAHCNA